MKALFIVLQQGEERLIVYDFPFLREKLTQTKYNELSGKGCLSLDHAQALAISRKEQTDNFRVNTVEALPIKLITIL